ncbi:hypothetical protein FB451DRAFT_1565298 [Mycena latifolia]|nr:hypothetical protein FB451DRAFT_1565298 [Mycena latifolia]
MRWANLSQISLSFSSATHDMHPIHGLTPPSSELLAPPHSSAQQVTANRAQDSNNWTSGRERGGA